MDTVTGGIIENGGSVKLTINSAKKGSIVLPNGELLNTVAGVINTTYVGKRGNLLYLVQKGQELELSNSGVGGKLTYNGSAVLNAASCPLVTELNALLSPYVGVTGNTILTSLVAPVAVVVQASSCALTAKSIGDILKAAYTANRMSVAFNFSLGNNALEGAVDTYLQSTYSGLTYATVYTKLVTDNGGTILIDAV